MNQTESDYFELLEVATGALRYFFDFTACAHNQNGECLESFHEDWFMFEGQGGGDFDAELPQDWALVFHWLHDDLRTPDRLPVIPWESQGDVKTALQSRTSLLRHLDEDWSVEDCKFLFKPGVSQSLALEVDKLQLLEKRPGQLFVLGLLAWTLRVLAMVSEHSHNYDELDEHCRTCNLHIPLISAIRLREFPWLFNVTNKPRWCTCRAVFFTPEWNPICVKCGAKVEFTWKPEPELGL